MVIARLGRTPAAWKKGSIIGATVMLLMCILVSPASAASYPSTAAYYGPVAGYSYYNKSTLVISGSGNWAEASVTRTGSTPPAGWMGAQVTLYKNGAQCSAGNMLYTTSAVAYFSRSTFPGYCGAGTLNARGSTAAYNGSGYNYYYTNYSPSQYTSP